MQVLSYLRTEIDADQMSSYEEDLEEMLRIARGERLSGARRTVDLPRAQRTGEPEAMRSFLMQERHVEI